MYHLAPVGEADRIRDDALAQLARLRRAGLPSLRHMTRFAPRQFAKTASARAAQFREFDQFVRRTTSNSGDEQTIAMALYLRAHVRIAASRRLTDFTPTERHNTQKILQQLATEYGRVKSPSGETFGEKAKAAIFELQQLHVGAVPPNIQSVDFDGKPFDLRALRGRVVVLNFWATWCPPCMAEIPFERKLVKKYSARPLVFIGINGDSDETAARRYVRRNAIPWKNIPNGPWPQDTCISKQWNTKAWPTYYVVDAKGTIAFRSIKTGEPSLYVREQLTAAIDAALARAESE